MLGIAVLVLVAVVSVSYRQWQQFKRANAEVALSRGVVDSIDLLLSSLIDAETGQRGFLLTGENRYLEPYNQAVQIIPNELGTVRRLLAGRASDAGNMARLDNLADQKLAELRQTIDLRRTQGVAAATAVVLTDQGKQVMDEIRAVCAEIRRSEISSQSQASIEGEAGAQTVLLATVAGSLVLLIFFSIGFEPFMSRASALKARPWFLSYGAAVVATGVAILLRVALTPLLAGSHSVVPYITFFPTVLFVTWYGGFRAGAFSILLSALAVAYVFLEPLGSLRVANPGDLVTLFIFVLVSCGIAFTTESQRRAVERADRAENAEREQRQRLETTLASIGDAVIATDTAGRVTFANKIALSLVRWPETEIPGKELDQVFRIVNEFTRATVESPVTKVLREGVVVGLANHTVLIAQDGTEIPIDDSAAPIRVGDGAVQGTVLVFRDITDRRRAEATSRLLASIVESSDDAIISKDLNGIVTTWNKGAARMFDYAAEEMIGQPISVLAAPDRVDEMPDILGRIRQGEHVDHFQTVRRTKGGRLIHVSVSVSPVRDAAGQITGASKIVRDITTLVEAQAELAEQRERLHVTLSSIGDAVMATDTNGRVSYLNPMAEQLTAWASGEAEGRPLEEVFRIINEESRQTVGNPVTRVLREGKVVGLANHTVLISRNGNEIAIDDSAAPIRDARGEMMGVVLVFRDVREKRAAEQLLAAQNFELRQRTHLLEYAHCFVRSIPEDRIVYWSPGATELYGFSDADAVGQSSHTLLKTEFPAPLDEILSQLMKEGHWDGDLAHTCRDGRRVTVASHWALHRDAEGRVASVLEVNLDITERRRAEDALRAALRELQIITDNMVAGVTRCSRDLRYLWVSRNYADWLRLAPEEIMGRPILDVVGSAGYEGIRPHIEKVLAGEKVGYEAQVNFHGAGGRWIHAVYVPTMDEDQEVNGWIAVVTDITEYRQAEERFRLAVEAAPNGMVVADEGGKIVLVNSEMERLFGWSREEIIGQLVEFLVPQRLNDEHQRYRESYYADPRARRMGEGRDLRARRKDGSEFPVEIALNPIETSQGRWVLGAIVDITERKRVEEQRLELLSKERALVSERTLRETEAELARVVRALSVGELAASIAHEVNQPLAGVVTNAEAGLRWLGGESPSLEEAKESLALIVRDGNRASAVIRRIREFLKKESPDSASIDINEAIQEAVALAQAELVKRQIILRLELSGDLPPMRGDRIQLQQVMLNLIMNGGEAMVSTEGSKELRVTSQESAEPGGRPGVLVAVRDCGAGIEPPDMQRMFDAFFTTKPKGMGMGLSISRSIVEAHGGRIWAEANDGPGLTVQFTLPGGRENQRSSDASSPS